MKLLTTIITVCCCITVTMSGQSRRSLFRQGRCDFFATEDANRVADNVILYQRTTGGWPKNIDMSAELTDDQKRQIAKDKKRRDDSTIDNNATTTQMSFLACLYAACHRKDCKVAFGKGLKFLLDAQYDNGGWPQFWPEMRDYQPRITYNDNAMINVLCLLQSIAESRAPYDNDIVTATERKAAKTAFDKGISCILHTQILVDGEPTVWCQQHDEKTLAPAGARAYELASYCSKESAEIVKLLMSLPQPSQEVCHAVHCAMLWFDQHKMSGLRYTFVDENGVRTRSLVESVGEPPIWARFYDLQRGEPFVCDRDGVPRKSLEELGIERRNGYGWYTDSPRELYAIYDKWADQNDPEGKVDIKIE